MPSVDDPYLYGLALTINNSGDSNNCQDKCSNTQSYVKCSQCVLIILMHDTFTGT